MPKRSLDIDDLSIVSPCKSAKIQGVVMLLSPMKGDSKYFDGRLGDGKGSIRLVGFDSKKQEQLSKMFEKGQPVTLEDCQLKKGKFSEEMELLLSSSTASQKKFNVCSNAISTEITLDAVEKLENYQAVHVKASHKKS